MTHTHDSELDYVARLILAEGLGAVPWIDKTHPSITNRLRALSHMQVVLRNASVYLHAHPPLTLGVAAYLSWAGLVYIEKGRHALPLPFIQADKVQFVSWGFDSPLLSQLAHMQGVMI